MEETVQELFEASALVRNGTVKLTRPLNELKIPSTVQALLASRMDRLPPDEKALLQTLAVIGREFSLALLKHIVAKSHGKLNQMLASLQLGEFIYEQPAAGDFEFIFKHALIHDVAANSMSLRLKKCCSSGQRKRSKHSMPPASTITLMNWPITMHAAPISTRQSSIFIALANKQHNARLIRRLSRS
jgi:hypothetical protein